MKHQRITLSMVLGVALVLQSPTPARATGVPVVDVAAIAKLIDQIRQFAEMIAEMKKQYDVMKNQYDMLKEYAEIDHDGLANVGKFLPFLEEYTRQFDAVLAQIEDYHDGGLLGQLKRLDTVYWSYHTDWDEMDEEGDFMYDIDPNTKAIKKQVLWTKIQLKHAAYVAAQIRKDMPATQEQINVLLQDTNEAEGHLLVAQIGNELMATVAKSLNTLNLQLTEVVQAQVADGLQKNQQEGNKFNRSREALEDWGTEPATKKLAPLNPFGAFSNGR